jgi:copper chaperone CopZ
VEEALKHLDGVQDFKVEAPPKDHAFVIFDPATTNPDKIKEAIIDIGYDVENIVESN